MSTEPQANADRVIPTGSLALDRALGIGGWPRGRIVELFGPEGSGKTTLVLEAIAQAQRTGTGALIDADHGTDRDAVRRLGVDPHGLVWHRGNVLDELRPIIEQFIARGIDVIAIDGIGSLLLKDSLRDNSFPPRIKDEEFQKAVEHWLKTLLAPLSKSRSVLLITNQLREKLGVMYGNPDTTPWEALPLKDFASVRADVRRITHIKEGEKVVGSETRVRVVKNRLAAPHQAAELEIYFDRGIATERELVNLGLEGDVLTQSGVAVRFGTEMIGRSRDDAVRRLRNNTKLADRLYDTVVASFTPVPVPPTDEGEANAG